MEVGTRISSGLCQRNAYIRMAKNTYAIVLSSRVVMGRDWSVRAKEDRTNHDACIHARPFANPSALLLSLIACRDEGGTVIRLACTRDISWLMLRTTRGRLGTDRTYPPILV